MRIGIVNDTRIIVEALRRVIATVPDYEIVWVAINGAQAVSKCAIYTPDLILMDLVMPQMDGVQATQIIMNQYPCAILIVTDSVKRNCAKIFEAMGYGALDVVNPPIIGSEREDETAQILLDKIAMIGTLIGFEKKRRSILPHSFDEGKKSQEKQNKKCSKTTVTPTLFPIPPLVVMGASTGGPNALAKILSQLSLNFPAAIIIIQHLESQFAPGLAKWLDNQTPLSVSLAIDGDYPQVGKVLLAGSQNHLLLSTDLSLRYTREPEDYPYRPSVDVFFTSLAQHWKRKGIAILLTGMGKDGAKGLSQLRQRGWHTIAQEESSCVIYGMPKAAIELGAAVDILSLEAMVSVLNNQLSF